ncbi:uncharacterized protein F5Z01DRAFT_638529 [Emericellopsis atlantica]|uniref:Uncharacterized protein n=1 Tax=Emericellopsis atlantica TaxID=2614577 RepID=A0A9P8CMQ4_9HYPO|nr:uncharacterized protein F5Z01DRAFT_638529 [Emericellopsis atlantica]KAG9252255.1 hypothetical protein F5Z01DRAFT_638529 [Emericellopsis atlantica]
MARVEQRDSLYQKLTSLEIRTPVCSNVLFHDNSDQPTDTMPTHEHHDEEAQIGRLRTDVDRTLVEMNAKLLKMKLLLSELWARLPNTEAESEEDSNVFQALAAAQQVSTDAKAQRLGRMPAPQRTKRLCASGACKNQAVVTAKGKKGIWCREHTCAARDWDCVEEVYRFKPLDWEVHRGILNSFYCPRHTCLFQGCLVRVMARDAICCPRHLQLQWLSMAAREPERAAGVLRVVNGGEDSEEGELGNAEGACDGKTKDTFQERRKGKKRVHWEDHRE